MTEPLTREEAALIWDAITEATLDIGRNAERKLETPMTDSGWRYLKKYGRIVVEGPGETYSLSNERTARNIAEGRAYGRLTPEQAQHLEKLDHSRYGVPKPARKVA